MFDDSWTQGFPGFILALLGAIFLTVLVNPWVARRAERRSRWLDRAQMALEHLTWDVEPALRASMQEAMTTIPLRNEHRLTDATEVLDLLDKWSKSEHERFVALSTYVKRTATLMRYVCYARPDSAALRSLDMQWRRVELYLRGIENVRLDIATTQDDVSSSYNEAQANLTRTIQMLERMVFSGGQPRHSFNEVLRRSWQKFSQRNH